MQVVLAVCLPRDEVSIQVARHIIQDALRAVGVAESCLQDVAIALSEACTNVVQHSGPGDQYEVRVEITDERCVLSVIDKGHGFDSAIVGDSSDLSSERGRGIVLMRALVDDIHFVSDPESGTAVRLEKTLEFRDDAAFRAGR
ncbi:MAG: ATP-binding protein [Acidimicrobiales bacterium]